MEMVILQEPRDMTVEPDEAMQLDEIMIRLRDRMTEICTDDEWNVPKDLLESLYRSNDLQTVRKLYETQRLFKFGPDDKSLKCLWLMFYTDKSKEPPYSEIVDRNEDFIEAYRCLLDLIKSHANEKFLSFEDLHFMVLTSYRSPSEEELRSGLIPSTSLRALYSVLGIVQLASVVKARDLYEVRGLFPFFDPSVDEGLNHRWSGNKWGMFTFAMNFIYWSEWIIPHKEERRLLKMRASCITELLQGWISGMPDEFVIESMKMTGDQEEVEAC